MKTLSEQSASKPLYDNTQKRIQKVMTEEEKFIYNFEQAFMAIFLSFALL